MTTIITKFVGPTNYRGARIIADAGMKRRITVSYDYGNKDPHRHAAMELCKKFDWHGQLVQGGMERGSAFVFLSPEDTFSV